MSEPLDPTDVRPRAPGPGTNAARGAGKGGECSRKAATQNSILRAGMELFAARGYERTSITNIATRAGVSRTSIFWHFGDKATLFHETCRHFLVPFRESLEHSVVQLDPYDRLWGAIATYERFIEENRATIRAFVSWIFASPPHADPLREELLDLHLAFVGAMTRTLTEILADPDEAPAVATSLVSMLHGNMLLSLGDAREDHRISRAELLRAFVDSLVSSGAAPSRTRRAHPRRRGSARPPR